MVLEITNEESKRTSDSDVCTLRELLDELSESVPVFTINYHTLERTSAMKDGKNLRRSVLSRFVRLESTLSSQCSFRLIP